MVRQNYSTVKGSAERVNSASPDARQPPSVSQNFLGGDITQPSPHGGRDSQEYLMDDPARKRLTFNEMHSPIVKAASRRSLENETVSPRVDLDPMVRASQSRRQEARNMEAIRSRADQRSREAASRDMQRPMTNSNASASPYRARSPNGGLNHLNNESTMSQNP